MVDRHDGHHAEPASTYAHWLRAKGYDSRDPWTDFVIGVEDAEGRVLSGWKMRHAGLPARVREEHSETAYTTDVALSRWPKVLQQAFQPESVRGYGSLATCLLWRQRQEPGSCIVGQGVD